MDEFEIGPGLEQGPEARVPRAGGRERLRHVQGDDLGPERRRGLHGTIGRTGVDVHPTLPERVHGLEAATQALALVAPDDDDADASERVPVRLFDHAPRDRATV